MHYFRYRGNVLYCDSVRVKDIAEKAGTPVYIYSHRTLIEHYRKIKNAFASLRPLICFSMKSNSSLALCRALVKAGSGLDIVSGGELFKALKIGADPGKIVYASVGKTPDEISRAIKAGILFFNVESIPELCAIEKMCGRLKKRAKISLRVNPEVDAHTHHYITTGTQENKFGIDIDTVTKIFRQKDCYRHLDIVCLHVHIGSQITESGPFVKAVRKVSSLIRLLRSEGHKIDYLNIGGGMGIVYRKERPQTAADFAKAVAPLIKKLGVKLILEPGRFISGNSGILVAKVLYVKKSKSKNFIITDAAMNDLARPSLYGAYHEIVPVHRSSSSRARMKYDVVGPICESGDFLAKGRRLAAVKEGELLAVMGAGAYGFAMSSNYNARPRSAEVMAIGRNFYVTRKRETYADLVRGERIPGVLK
ncbi:MAG: diaminopimelate decarboxylase [Candidatus Omnitrophica bacterium]|nr:diaminopimelate decarboxylase [Candidatus Omnitrophota bacterium]